ncbi:MAG: ATP-binding cassette domain-containing protein [Methanobacteriota archaeon]|nr:MAG: ATP-binding cassette domain-containing protein [Euryarchaeota archaeon]
MYSEDAVVIVDRLEKVYSGDVRAVDSISFEVGRGAIFGFLGPNGAGKTTTISILTTQTMPTGGRAEVLGYDVVKEPSKVRKGIGLVPQELTVDDELTGRENMELQGSLYGVPYSDAKGRIDELLDLVKLADSADRYVKTYSGGMKKRLELAEGLIHRPEVLFLDEPTLGLDVQTRTSMWEHINKLKRETNMTIFLTTHYLEEADALCDRIGIIDHGRIIALDTPEGLKKAVGGDVIEIEVVECEDDILEMIRNMTDVVLVDGACTDNRARIKVPDSGVALPKILTSLIDRDVQVASVMVRKPSLDQAFLEFTGRDLRDEESTSGNNKKEPGPRKGRFHRRR